MSVAKLVVIGLDGATWDLVRPWVDAGQLPNLARLRAHGVYGRLASTIQPVSAPAWVSFLTGVNQGQHGIFDFVRRKANSYDLELTNSSMIGAPTLFEYLGQAGLRIASVNVPFTYPVWQINGVMIGGPFAPSTGPSIVYPRDFWSELSKAVPGYEILPDYHPQAENPQEKLAADLVTCVRNRTLATELVLRKEEWDVLIVVYTSTDQVQHSFWHYLPPELSQAHSDSPSVHSHPHLRDAILSVYQEADAGIGRILGHTKDDTLVLVLSDHGSGRLDWWVHLNRWLEQHGYLSYRAQTKLSAQSLQPNTVGTLIKAYARVVPQPLRKQIRHMLGTHFSSIKERLETWALAASIDWSHTRAYALGSGDIYINLRGREPAGTVAPGAEYESLRDELVAELAKLASPDGKALVERVYRREELYHGQLAHLAPDLTVVLADHRFQCIARYASSASVFEDPGRWRFDTRPLTGGHYPDGVLILSGEKVRSGIELQGARIVDLAPTILAALGFSVPQQMDGRVLDEAFWTPPAVTVPTKEYSETSLSPTKLADYTPEEEAQIERHLADLGYL